MGPGHRLSHLGVPRAGVEQRGPRPSCGPLAFGLLVLLPCALRLPSRTTPGPRRAAPCKAQPRWEGPRSLKSRAPGGVGLLQAHPQAAFMRPRCCSRSCEQERGHTAAAQVPTESWLLPFALFFSFFSSEALCFLQPSTPMLFVVVSAPLFPSILSLPPAAALRLAGDDPCAFGEIWCRGGK